jgi:drug/metabolite transporter (DMT)-like permease
VTGLGYLFYFIAIRCSDATTGSIAFFIKPAIAPFLAVLLLNETVYWNTIVGIVLLVSASFLTLYDARRGLARETLVTVSDEAIQKLEAERTTAGARG